MLYRYYFLGFFFLLFFLNLLYLKLFDSHEILSYSFKKKTSLLRIYAKTLKKKCNPFIQKPKQFSIRINNQTYPKSMPLSKKNSINYKCLNRNKKLKVILLWNTFFGNLHFNFGIGKSDIFKEKK